MFVFRPHTLDSLNKCSGELKVVSRKVWLVSIITVESRHIHCSEHKNMSKITHVYKCTQGFRLRLFIAELQYSPQMNVVCVSINKSYLCIPNTTATKTTAFCEVWVVHLTLLLDINVFGKKTSKIARKIRIFKTWFMVTKSFCAKNYFWQC